MHFVEDGEVDLAKGSPIEGEMMLPKSYFKAGLRLPFMPLFRDVVSFLQLTPNQLCINTMRIIMSLVVLDHMRGLGISVKDILYIYTLKRSQIPNEWYLSPCLGMNGFIIGAASTNKALDRSLVVV